MNDTHRPDQQPDTNREQADLLEHYLLALHTDPAAPPPPGLDADLADFARGLVATQPRPLTGARQRVWARTLASTRSPNGKPDEEAFDMMLTPTLPRRPQPLTWLAAALALVIFGGLLLASYLPDGGDGEPPFLVAPLSDDEDDRATQIAQEPTVTPTPLATVVPPAQIPVTATPVPLSLPTAIPTALPPGAVASTVGDAIQLNIGEPYSGPIGPDNPQATFQFVAPETGPYIVQVSATGFNAVLAHQVINADPNRGGGGGGGGGGGVRPDGTPFSEATMSLDLMQGDQVALTLRASQPDQSGTFELRVQPVFSIEMGQGVLSSPPVDVLIAGEPYTGEIGAQESVQVYRFVPDSSGLYTVQLDGNLTVQTFAAPPGANLNINPATTDFVFRGQPALTLRDSTITLVNPDAPGSPADHFTFNVNPLLPGQPTESFVWVPGGGEAAVWVRQFEVGEAATFTLSLAPAEAQGIAYGDTIDAALDADSRLSYYTFDGAAGDVVTLRVNGADGFDTRLRLFSNDGRWSVVDDDGSGGYDPEIFRVRLPQTGTYHVLVEPAVTGSGAYQLELTREPPLELDAGAQTIDLTSKTIPQLTFAGAAGDAVTLTVSLPDGVDAAAVRRLEVVLTQNDTPITTLSRDFGPGGAAGTTLLSGSVTLPADGPVMVALNGTFAPTDGDLGLTVAVE